MKINLLEYFEETVQSYPDRLAVREGELSINFAQLYEAVLHLSGYIVKSLGGVFNKPIAVFLPKCIQSVKADLAITFSGNFYMNLDVRYPETRIKNILNLIKPTLIITNAGYKLKIKELSGNIPILNVDELDLNYLFDKISLWERLNRIIDTDPYCLINTSGSTGTPKGVILNHRSFIDFTEWAVKTLGITDNEIVGSLSPLIFDIYSFEICMLMARGSTIILIPESLSAFPLNILKLLQQTSVSFIFWVPTIMVNIANMDLLSRMHLSSLRMVWFAGEVFPTKQFNYWYRFLPQTKFVNLYGPIEITLDCTYFIVNRPLKDDEPIPIGFPCRNTDVLILNDENNLVKTEEEGELCVRGSSLAMGYYNNSDKTTAAFTQNPLNTSYPEIVYRTGDIVSRNSLNEIIFRGRKDSLVKHLGYRIELGEIEHVIVNTLKLANNCCVIYDSTKREIVLFYESANELDISEFRREISTVFPKYMIPNCYIKMEVLPKNINGKIDRLVLNNKVNGR